jgi:hypothetical protein
VPNAVGELGVPVMAPSRRWDRASLYAGALSPPARGMPCHEAKVQQLLECMFGRGRVPERCRSAEYYWRLDRSVWDWAGE